MKTFSDQVMDLLSRAAEYQGHTARECLLHAILLISADYVAEMDLAGNSQSVAIDSIKDAIESECRR